MSPHDRQPSLSDILQLDPARVARLTTPRADSRRATRELSAPHVTLPDVEKLRRQDREQLTHLREQLLEERETRRALERHLIELRQEVAELRLAAAQLPELAGRFHSLRQESERQQTQLRFARRLYQRYQKELGARRQLEEQVAEFRSEVARLRLHAAEMENVDRELSIERQKRETAERLLKMAEKRAEMLQALLNEKMVARSRSPLQRIRLWFRRLLGREMANNSL